ncbi:MAG: TAXI family TRAP transporter solute-binding subunit [Betaproteobacteria bacterium]|nr:TAXI family TRAP transporter solute-binding subunit [Betaproteobacteria bacterium]
MIPGFTARLTQLLALIALAGLSMQVHAQVPQRPQVLLTHLTAPAGIGEFEWGLSIDRILAKQSAWLRQRSQPTQGYIYNLRTAIDASATWNTLVFNMDPVSPWLASKKQPPFENGMGDLELRGLMNATWPVWFLLTKAPDVKTVKDLAGRRVALGPKAGTASLMMEETLKAAGVYDKVVLQHLSFADITNGLLDDTIDVGLANLWMNGAANKIGPTQGIVTLQASGKPFRYVLIDRATLEKTRNERGVPYKIVNIPNGTLPLQTQEMSSFVNPDYVAVHRNFPEESAYEYVRLVIRHLDEVNQVGGIASIFTREFLPFGIDNLHPGAIRAYREAGLLK